MNSDDPISVSTVDVNNMADLKGKKEQMASEESIAQPVNVDGNGNGSGEHIDEIADNEAEEQIEAFQDVEMAEVDEDENDAGDVAESDGQDGHLLEMQGSEFVENLEEQVVDDDITDENAGEEDEEEEDGEGEGEGAMTAGEYEVDEEGQEVQEEQECEEAEEEMMEVDDENDQFMHEINNEGEIVESVQENGLDSNEEYGDADGEENEGEEDDHHDHDDHANNENGAADGEEFEKGDTEVADGDEDNDDEKGAAAEEFEGESDALEAQEVEEAGGEEHSENLQETCDNEDPHQESTKAEETADNKETEKESAAVKPAMPELLKIDKSAPSAEAGAEAKAAESGDAGVELLQQSPSRRSLRNVNKRKLSMCEDDNESVKQPGSQSPAAAASAANLSGDQQIVKRLPKLISHPQIQQQSQISKPKKSNPAVVRSSATAEEDGEDDDDVQVIELDDGGSRKAAPKPSGVSASPQANKSTIYLSSAANSATALNLKKSPTSTIIVNDTKHLARIAAKTGGHKKEPTLVIIDTKNSLSSPASANSASTGSSPNSAAANAAAVSSSISALSSRGINIVRGRSVTSNTNNSGANATLSKATITPIHGNNKGKPLSSSLASSASGGSMTAVSASSGAFSLNRNETLLPSLTDDMFVVEAPSFIVPYVYEKPSSKSLRTYLTEMKKEIETTLSAKKKKSAGVAGVAGTVGAADADKAEKKKPESGQNNDDNNNANKGKRDEAQESSKKNHSAENNASSEKSSTSDNDDKGAANDADAAKKSGLKTPSKEDGAEKKKNGEKMDVDEDGKADEEETKAKAVAEAEAEAEEEEFEYDSDEPLKQNSLLKEKSDAAAKKGPHDSASSSSANAASASLTAATSPSNYFESPIGKFLIKIGFNLVREPVQEDLLRQQKRIKNKTAETEHNITSLMKNIEISKEQNSVFKQELKKCEHCNFKTESILVLLNHMQRPHMRNNVYMCSYCKEETNNAELIIKHITVRHQIQPWLERPPPPFQCPNCLYEDYQRGKLSRHVISCMKRFRLEDNLSPPVDWEPPAKIPRIPRVKQTGLAGAASAYQMLAAQQNKLQHSAAASSGSFQQQNHAHHAQAAGHAQQRGGHANALSSGVPLTALQQQQQRNRNNQHKNLSGQMSASVSSVPSLMSVNSSIANFARFHNSSITATKTNLPKSSIHSNASHTNQNKPLHHHPSISITPLPRNSNSGGGRHSISNSGSAGAGHDSNNSSGAAAAGSGNNAASKPNFVICEICDGYIKDLEMLRNHMQWIHKVKIHPKMIYNRPPLNCQKCQFRFFTDQGLERHLLGSHGLVTSSMQDAANKNKDGGRCPICGKVYQWKLLNHVSKEHNLTLKPAHLSYKCTVCTATFGMYKQFENHVYSAHSIVAKKTADKKPGAPAASGGSQQQQQQASGAASGASAGATSAHKIATAVPASITVAPATSTSSTPESLRALKINDEITIIPQPAKK